VRAATATRAERIYIYSRTGALGGSARRSYGTSLPYRCKNAQHQKSLQEELGCSTATYCKLLAGAGREKDD
jgi:hypothetical protein